MEFRSTLGELGSHRVAKPMGRNGGAAVGIHQASRLTGLAQWRRKQMNS
jgi:hypothetical protein